jgi:hypothetical protein
MFRVNVGPHSGYEHQPADHHTTNGEQLEHASIATTSVRNGREIFVKGVSLKMQFSLDKVVPW